MSRYRIRWVSQPQMGRSRRGFPYDSAAKSSQHDNRGCKMLVAHRRASDICRPGGPTGVALGDSPRGRTTANVGAKAMQPGRPDARAVVVPEKRSRWSLLTDANATFVDSAASVRS
jgi:hypothetical protein